MKSRTMKWLRLMIPGGVVLQLSTCLGANPDFFFAQTVASTLINNVVTTVFQLFTNALTL